MRRRDVLAGGVAAGVCLAVPARAAGEPFDGNTVRALAKDLASKPYKAPNAKLPDAIAKLNYDQYRMIRFDARRALWRGLNLPFEAQLLHRGFLYNDRVDLHEVADGRSTPIAYSQDMFDFGPLAPPALGDLGFAGFRIHAPINRADYFDEVCVFVGASYFRAVAKGQGYGLSARGLSIKTGDPGGEEFPGFRAFWLERPRPGVDVVVVHALLDSQSCAAAYRFTIRPGTETVFDVESVIYPRVDIDQVGLATMTSMFDFDPSARAGVDDWRAAVHDSDGMQIANGHGDQLWRPLANPHDLQVSVFEDNHPRGFGLMQRARNFRDYQDLEAHYERRPSLWVEPIGDVGEGGVHLVEIPTKGEIHDNIVAFWRPRNKLLAKSETGFTYRLRWCNDLPATPDLARISHTRAGSAGEKARLFVLDIAGDALKKLAADAKPSVAVAADHGKILHAVAQPNPETGGWRASFELAPAASVVELRAQLMLDTTPLSEVWVYRWTA